MILYIPFSAHLLIFPHGNSIDVLYTFPAIKKSHLVYNLPIKRILRQSRQIFFLANGFFLSYWLFTGNSLPACKACSSLVTINSLLATWLYSQCYLPYILLMYNTLLSSSYALLISSNRHITRSPIKPALLLAK